MGCNHTDTYGKHMSVQTESRTGNRIVDLGVRYLVKYPELAALITWVAVALLFVFLNPSVMLQADVWGNIFRQTALIGPVAILVALLMIGGDFDMTVGANYALSAMFFISVVNAGFDPLIGMVATLLVGGTIGVLNGVLVTFTGIHSFIITLGGWFSIRGLLLLTFDGGVRLEGEHTVMQIFSYELGANFELMVLWLFALLAAAWYLVHRTQFGNHLYAVGSDREAARARGIRVTRTRIIAFTLTGATVSFAAMMHVARFGSARPVLQVELPLVAIAAAVLGGCALFGGRGSPLAGFLGALTFGTFFTGLIAAGATTAWYEFFVGVVLVGAVIFNRYIDTLREELR